jgi:hypothetical protein
MTPKQRDWLLRVGDHTIEAIVRLKENDLDGVFDYLRKLFHEPVEVDEATWNVKNLIASLAMTDPDTLRGRAALINAAIERLNETWEYITSELTHDTIH